MALCLFFYLLAHHRLGKYKEDVTFSKLWASGTTSRYPLTNRFISRGLNWCHTMYLALASGLNSLLIHSTGAEAEAMLRVYCSFQASVGMVATAGSRDGWPAHWGWENEGSGGSQD